MRTLRADREACRAVLSAAAAALALALLPPARADADQFYSIFLTAPNIPSRTVAIPPRTYPPRAQEFGVPIILAQPYIRGAGLYRQDWRQQWRLRCDSGRAGYVPYSGSGAGPLPACVFINRDSGRCLDISGPSSANGAKVHQWNCSSAVSQLWIFTGTQIRSVYATNTSRVPKCLDVTNFNVTPDYPANPLQIFACSSGWNQQFRLHKADPPPPRPPTPQEPR